MKKPKNIERIKYLAYHHKRARVRKKNLKRLQKYGVVTFNFNGFVKALRDVGKALSTIGSQVGKALAAIGGNWHYGSDAGLFSTNFNRYVNTGLGYRIAPLPLPDNADRCVCCGEIIPEGRQVCPNCERSVEQWTSQSTEKEC